MPARFAPCSESTATLATPLPMARCPSRWFVELRAHAPSGSSRLASSHELRGTTLIQSSMHVPEPVISLAIASKNKRTDANFMRALNKFQKEDPTFRVTSDKESNQVCIFSRSLARSLIR